MSYQALYRKYRPKDLNEVYGQNVAVNILKNAIMNNKFGHAYLFTGSRGCGKTSVAKIMSRLVNCENHLDGKICGVCNNCINSESTSCVDIIEIDAASNNGVDEIRELKNKVSLIPTSLKYKVYIIDEVHMLSIGAFNALLKTLEEPPEHVIFILATTELHKVPITIVSRCQTIEFKKINNKDMFSRLKEISNMENINITDDALNEIVNVSDGGLRDAIGMLDMATSYTNDQITDEDIFAINGNISNEEIEYMTEQLLKKNTNTVISLINEYYNNGKDLIKIIEKMIVSLKNTMIKNNDANICLILKRMTETLEKMKNSNIGKIYFEVAVFELNNKSKVYNEMVEEVIVQKNESPKSVEKNIESSKTEVEIKKEEPKLVTESVDKIEKTIEIVDKNKTNINVDELKKIRINNTFVEVNKQSLQNIKDNWDKLNDYTFDKDYGAIACELLDASPVAASDKYLMLSYNYDSFVEKGNCYIDKYERTLNTILGINNKVIFVTNDEWEKIKNEYIINIKNNVKYNYIDEKGCYNQTDNNNENQITSVSKSSDLVEKANELFNIEKIEIKGE